MILATENAVPMTAEAKSTVWELEVLMQRKSKLNELEESEEGRKVR